MIDTFTSKRKDIKH